MKRTFARLLIFVFLGLVCCRTFGMFMYEETEKVPIERLLANLRQRLAKNTNDFELTYQLARVHSMAYATNLTDVDVTKESKVAVYNQPGEDKGVPEWVQVFKTAQAREDAFKHLTNALAFYQRSLVLLQRATNAYPWQILPVQLGQAWCLDQSGQRDKALDAYRKTLRVAWKQEVAGDFDFKEWVKGVWNDVQAGKNPVHSRRRGSIGPGVCFSEETIGYLLKLLDPVKDAKEIAQLKQDRQTLNTMGRAISPIIVPLQADVAMADMANPSNKVTFDLDGSGRARKWSWITPRAAWLVYDPNGSGKITSALQMFGNVTFWIFWQDGYAALASLDDNGDGVLRGPELRGLALWQDRNENGISDPGEVLPVQSFGITAISCHGGTFSGNTKWNPFGITFSNGEVRPTYDLVTPSE